MYQTNKSVRASLKASINDPRDEIVISGVSGRFPSSRNMREFADNLYNKVDMVDDSEARWRHTNPIIPKRSGKNQWNREVWSLFLLGSPSPSQRHGPSMSNAVGAFLWSRIGCWNQSECSARKSNWSVHCLRNMRIGRDVYLWEID